MGVLLWQRDVRAIMDSDTFNKIENNNIDALKSTANTLILVLEDIIEMITSSSSDAIKPIKEKAKHAKHYSKLLKESIIKADNMMPKGQWELYLRKIEIYNDQYIDDIITAWILNGANDNILDSLYSACYKIRELVKNIKDY